MVNMANIIKMAKMANTANTVNVENNENTENNQVSVINYNHDVEYLNKIYQYNQKIKINYIFENVFAESVYSYALREKNWVLSSGIDKNKYEKQDLPQFQKANELQIKNVNKAFSENHFGYIFYRAMNNKIINVHDGFLEYLIRKELSSPKFIQFLRDITGLELTTLKTLFMSKYKPGNFLSPHSDKGNGKLAFVINLTKNWKPQYGGNLNFLNLDRTEIVETFVPDFNNIVLFTVDDNKEAPHFVSHVVSGIKHNRYAITGWFD